MSESDPIVFAAIVAGLSDAELREELARDEHSEANRSWKQALEDEMDIRHLRADYSDPPYRTERLRTSQSHG